MAATKAGAILGTALVCCLRFWISTELHLRCLASEPYGQNPAVMSVSGCKPVAAFQHWYRGSNNKLAGSFRSIAGSLEVTMADINDVLAANHAASSTLSRRRRDQQRLGLRLARRGNGRRARSWSMWRVAWKKRRTSFLELRRRSRCPPLSCARWPDCTSTGS